MLIVLQMNNWILGAEPLTPYRGHHQKYLKEAYCIKH